MYRVSGVAPEATGSGTACATRKQKPSGRIESTNAVTPYSQSSCGVHSTRPLTVSLEVSTNASTDGKEEVGVRRYLSANNLVRNDGVTRRDLPLQEFGSCLTRAGHRGMDRSRRLAVP